MVIHDDPDAGYMIVDVPDVVHGLSLDDLAHEEVVSHDAGDHYAKLCDDCTGKVHSHWDDRYQERKGEFRLEFA
jgi:hypothetical protein